MPYIGRSTDGFGVRNRFIYLASSGDTSVSGADANGATLTFTDGAYVDVYLNGVLLKPTTDYNTSTAGTIAGLSALNTNDEVTVVVYDVFTVADMVSATSGGTFSGNVTFDGTVTNNDDVTFTGANYNVVWDKSDDALEFADSAKAVFGTGSDLSVHWDGTDGHITVGGTLNIDGSGETLAKFIDDGAVELYHNNVIKFATTANGVDVGGSGNSPSLVLKDMNSGVVAGDEGGGVYFYTNDGNGQGNSAAIIADYDNSAGGTSLKFAAGTGSSRTNYMRLHNEGCLMLGYHQSGRTAPAYTNRAFEAYSSTDNLLAGLIHNKSTGSYPAGLAVVYDGSPDDQDQYAFYFVDGTTTRFYVFNDGDVRNHDNSYGAISDERIKQDIVDSNSQWNDIKNIKVRNFKRKDDVAQYGDKAWSQIGVVAQEVETVCPNIIRESNPTSEDIKMSSEFGTLYEDGDTIPEGKQIGDVKEIKSKVKSIGYSVLYMKAVKALQEAMVRIETLEAKVKALEEA